MPAVVTTTRYKVLLVCEGRGWREVTLPAATAAQARSRAETYLSSSRWTWVAADARKVS